MTFSLGDTQPAMVFEVTADMTGATVVGSYYRPDGTVVERACQTIVSDVERNGYVIRMTTITWAWGLTDLTVPGIGSLRLRWTAGAERGTLQPSSGWRVVVLSAA